MYLFRSKLLILIVLLCPLVQAASIANLLLLRAAMDGNPVALDRALLIGADANARNEEGATALMLAVSSGKFSCTRALILAGADAAATTPDGRGALDFMPAEAEERQPIVLLLRCYAFLKAKATVAPHELKHPSLVLIMEDTVNYLHPRIKAAYHVNLAELQGKPGVDDDGNGFVDEIYGWNPVTQKPYEINPVQLSAYLRNREAIARIIKIDTDRREGRLSPSEADLSLSGFSNPLAQIMGPHPDLSDREFLGMVKNSAHGSHVAGIVLENSEQKANLHTLAIQSVTSSARPFGTKTEAVLEANFRQATSPEDFLQRCRAELLRESFELGKRYSHYIEKVGAGVANMSFGFDYTLAEQTTGYLLKRYINERQKHDTEYAPDEEEMKTLLGVQASEMYLAMAATWATVFYENPNVLFVCAAGNESKDNDETYGEPAYFSRFFPNVITVASVSEQGQLSSFSNYGRNSVNIAAVGENVLSTVIPEASIYMDGTSMAAPAVAGTAALVRSWKPSLSAAETRRLLEYTAGSNEHLKHTCVSGGAMDRTALRNLFFGTPAERSQVKAGMTLTAALFVNEDNRARAWRDADVYSQEAIKEAPLDGSVWWARAVFFDNTTRYAEARTFIDKAVKLDAENRRFWLSRAMICEHQGDQSAVVASFTMALALGDKDPEFSPTLKAGMLARRALALLKLGNKADALADARAALVAMPDGELPEELQALMR